MKFSKCICILWLFFCACKQQTSEVKNDNLKDSNPIVYQVLYTPDKISVNKAQLQIFERQSILVQGNLPLFFIRTSKAKLQQLFSSKKNFVFFNSGHSAAPFENEVQILAFDETLDAMLENIKNQLPTGSWASEDSFLPISRFLEVNQVNKNIDSLICGITMRKFEDTLKNTCLKSNKGKSRKSSLTYSISKKWLAYCEVKNNIYVAQVMTKNHNFSISLSDDVKNVVRKYLIRTAGYVFTVYLDGQDCFLFDSVTGSSNEVESTEVGTENASLFESEMKKSAIDLLDNLKLVGKKETNCFSFADELLEFREWSPLSNSELKKLEYRATPAISMRGEILFSKCKKSEIVKPVLNFLEENKNKEFFK